MNTCTLDGAFNFFVNAINSECGNCGFSNRSVTDRDCTCFPNNPSQITLHAKIQGTLERNASDLVDIIESWVQSGVMVVQNYNLSTDAALRIPSANGMCVPVDNTPPVTMVIMQDDETDSSGTDTMTTTGGAHIACSLCYTWILTLIILAVALGH